MNALFVICGIGVFALLAEVFNLKKWVTITSFLGILIALALLFVEWKGISYYYGGMLFFDHFALAFSGLILLVAAGWFWMATDFFKGEAHRTDKSGLVLFALVGAIMMVSFSNMAVLFLGIEILSISLYVLAGSDKENLFSTEAAFKYFLMGAFATGFLLFGITLVYGATGSFNLLAISNSIGTHEVQPRYLYIGILLMMVGLGFKISAVPFHQWAPDVYEGSPTPVTTFMSTVVKIAAFAAFYKVFSFVFARYDFALLLFVQGLMVLTLVVANVTAVVQTNVKRMLAYSSVGQVGYLLLAFSSDPKHSDGVIFFYLAAYASASLLAFTCVQLVERAKGTAGIGNFQGLFKTNPLVAVAMTVALFSLAGIPPLAGFFGKYLVFTLSVSKGYVALTVLAVFTSLVGVYYYFKPVITMAGPAVAPISVPLRDRILLVVLMVVTLAIGIFPDFIRII